jgi:phenylacetate-CoA ligase
LQLERLNEVWLASLNTIPYYQDLRIKLSLPDSFSSLDEFSEKVPICTKEHVQRLGSDLFATANPSNVTWGATGGSTGRHVHFPKWRSELNISESNEWYLRSKIGINPDDPYFRLWGHSHALGNGFPLLVRIVQRKIKDRALGMTRVSAYDLSESSILSGLKALAHSQAKYAYGYSRAWESYARILENLPTLRSRLPTLRWIIATSESFSSEASRLRVQDVFDAPVIMEYGSVETGPIAQEFKAGDYHAAWPAFYLEVVDEVDGAGRLLVTSLFNRAFPLVRYDLGDLVTGYDQPRGIKQFEKVIGRANLTFNCPDGTPLHGVSISHALLTLPEVEQFQVVTHRGLAVEILLKTSRQSAVINNLTEVRDRMARINQSLVELPIRVVEDVYTTPAGKRPTFFVIIDKTPDL